MALILLTNDDGIAAEGLRCLEECLSGLAELLVVAPDRQRSGVSHGLTLDSSLELNKLDAHHYTLNGTPADCVLYMLANMERARPDMVISGINHGSNLGDDLMYSGTVAAAREASRHGICALAVSQEYGERPISFKQGADFVRSLVGGLLQKDPNAGMCLNVNIPVRERRGVRITRQGCKHGFPYFDVPDGSEDLPGAPGATEHPRRSALVPDFKAVAQGYISITPLQRDQTDYAVAHTLHRMMPGVFRERRVPRMGLIRRGN